MGSIVRSALVGYSAAQMYALVEDIEAYPQFLPWCRSSRVLERTSRSTVAELTAGLKGLTQSFTTENLNTPGEAIELRLVKGPFKTFRARWKFQPLEAGASKIEFSM